MHYFSYHKIRSYGAPVMVIIAERGVGKSFGAKEIVVDEFLKKRSQFLYLRRYDNEIKELFEKTKGQKDFFQDLKKLDKYKDVELKGENRKFYCNSEVFGFAKRFTEAQDLKSSVYENVKTIIIDEYPIEDKRHKHYLKNEGMVLMSIIDTVARNRSDVKIIILGNAVNDLEFTPLFSFFNLSLPYNKEVKLFHDGTIAVQFANSEELRKERENTLVGRLAKGTDYEKYAMQNKILNKNNDFIEKKKRKL